DFLLVNMSGEFTLNDACSAFREVLATSAQHGATRVLFNCLQMWGNIPTAERYALGDFAARELISFISQRNVSPRLVVLAAEPLLDPNRFAELVARNRGVEIKIVERMEEGLKWLGVEREGRAVSPMSQRANPVISLVATQSNANP